MRKFNALLLGLLVIQIILVVVVYSEQGQAGAVPSGPYVKIDRSKLASVQITNGDGDTVTLKHTKNGWTAPERLDFPVNMQRLKGLIGGLDGTRPDLPVAVSKDARQRFHVAKDKFERHLVFKTDKGVAADLYLGDTAGAGRVYARLAGQDAIQELQFPIWRASAKVGDWLNKDYLEPTVSDLKQVTLPAVTLNRSDDQWIPADLPGDRLPDEGRIQSLLDHLRTLQWRKLDGRTDKVTLPGKPTFSMTVTPKQGKAMTYHFYETPGKVEGKGKKASKSKPTWRVTRSDSDFVFTVGDDRIEPLYTAKLADLTKAKPAPSKAKSGKDKGGDQGQGAKSTTMSPIKKP